MRFILYIALILLPAALIAQPKQQVDPNGYNKFYYDNGQVSSEGPMRDGKPDGYWKNYHPNGKIKTEGNRKNFLLDSTWRFYDEEGKITLEYNYTANKKNGFKRTYDPKKHTLTAEEYYTDDVKTGITNVYYPGGQLKQKTPFLRGREEGTSYEYDTIGNIISLVDYKYGFVKHQERINRTDRNGLKQGLWKEFYKCTKDCETKPLVVKREVTYTDGKMDGYLKEYNAAGDLVNTAKYVNGKLIENVPELAKMEIKKEYYDDAKVKASGSYKNGVPEGIHREYSPEGKITASSIYKEGVVVSKGIVDEGGVLQGPWEDYHPNGKLKAKGEYKNGKRVGLWDFYHANGQKEQTGKYDASGRAQGPWKWFYENGQVLREENYLNDKQDGFSTEYSDSGKVITKGEYIDGNKEGPWMYELNDYREEGNYKADQRDGMWKHYYIANNRLRFEGKYIDGNPDGKHTYYYPEGELMEEGKYSGGNKDGEWKIYHYYKYSDQNVGNDKDKWRYAGEEGTITLSILFKDGVEVKFDGVKVRPSQEEIDQGALKK